MAPADLPRYFKEFLRSLGAHSVEYLLIDLEHLKINKRAAGRHKDFDDLENLP